MSFSYRPRSCDMYNVNTLFSSLFTIDTGPEWRSFDKVKRVRTAPLKLVVKTDMAVKPEHGVRWRMLARFHRETLRGRERRLAKIGDELKRIRECAGLRNAWLRRLNH